MHQFTTIVAVYPCYFHLAVSLL